MIFDIRPRRSGKTMDLLFWLTAASKDQPRLLVVHSTQYAEDLYRQHSSLFSRPEVRVMSASAVQTRGLVGIHRNTRVAVDNINLVLPLFIGLPVEIVTGSPE